ncbi:MAG: hypothetical protein VB859_07545 [Planctomycetaceae bacterium]
MAPINELQRVEPGGFHIGCPHCQQELRIHRKYAGCHVECKLCRGRFRLNPESSSTRLVGFFAECPHCLEELRAAWRYRQARVACKRCGGRIQFVPLKPAQPNPAVPGTVDG